jgi:hypothetical protein
MASFYIEFNKFKYSQINYFFVLLAGLKKLLID